MKEQILSEIARLARETGKVPGKKAFARETGIRSHRWEGVLWARWSDALKEAGLEPNEMQGRLATEDVLAQVVEACRFFKRLPSSAELRLYGKENSAFPSHGAIRNHFATRAELVHALRRFVTERSEHQEIAALLPESAQALKEQTNPLSDGFVYLLKSGAHFKVGRSSDIERRIKSITISLPESVELIHAIKTDDPPGIEAYWHRRFAELRANGEWFKLGPREIAAFKRRTYQ